MCMNKCMLEARQSRNFKTVILFHWKEAFTRFRPSTLCYQMNRVRNTLTSNEVQLSLVPTSPLIEAD